MDESAPRCATCGRTVRQPGPKIDELFCDECYLIECRKVIGNLMLAATVIDAHTVIH